MNEGMCFFVNPYTELTLLLRVHPHSIEALAHRVIPCLTRDPVVCRHVIGLRVSSSDPESSSGRIKSGMTISDRLDWRRVSSSGSQIKFGMTISESLA